MASQYILLLALATVCRAHGLLPTVLLDKASPLSRISAEEILQEVNTGDTISKHLCKEAGFLCGTYGKLGSESNFLLGEPSAAAKADESIFFYGKVKSTSSSPSSGRTKEKPSYDNNFIIPSTMTSQQRASPAHPMHEHGNEDKAAVLFFRMATASKGHKIVLPPLADSSRLQATKFLHPSLEKVFGDLSLPQLLTAMGIPSRSELAHKTMEKERLCTGEGPDSEVKKCIASAHAMLEFAASVLKVSQHELKYMLNTRTQAASEVFEVVDSVILDQSFVTCHTVLFPYAVYMCHNIPKTVALKVTLLDSKGDKVTVLAICHMDTSGFEASHIGFQVLQTRPGVGEMCHWMPNSHILWHTEAAA